MLEPTLCTDRSAVATARRSNAVRESPGAGPQVYAYLESFALARNPNMKAVGFPTELGGCKQLRGGGLLRPNKPVLNAAATADLAARHGADALLALAAHVRWDCTNEGTHVGDQFVDYGISQCFEDSISVVAVLFDREGRVLWKNWYSAGRASPKHPPIAAGKLLRKTLVDVPKLGTVGAGS